jgi:hypothetical protein
MKYIERISAQRNLRFLLLIFVCRVFSYSPLDIEYLKVEKWKYYKEECFDSIRPRFFCCWITDFARQY